jgi:hypothetical protein
VRLEAQHLLQHDPMVGELGPCQPGIHRLTIDGKNFGLDELVAAA